MGPIQSLFQMKKTCSIIYEAVGNVNPDWIFNDVKELIVDFKILCYYVVLEYDILDNMGLFFRFKEVLYFKAIY